MADALTIIKDAMQDLGVLASGGTPTCNDQTDVLRKLNDMLDSWSTSSILVPFRTQISHVLTGAQSYTIGSGGDINTTRPTYIDSAYVNHQGIDYPVRVGRDRAEYDRIEDKSITGIPRIVYYEPSLPLGTLFIWYVGDASYTLKLNTRGQLTQFPDTSTDVDIAPGYKRAIVSNLAIEIAPMFEVSATAELVKKANESMAMIKRLNRQAPVMQYDSSIPTRNNNYNINSDG